MFSKILAALVFVAAVAAQSECPVPTTQVCCASFASGGSDGIKQLIGPNSKVPEGDFGQGCVLPSTAGCLPLTKGRQCQYFAERLGYAAGCATA